MDKIVSIPATILRELRNSINMPSNIVAKKLTISEDDLKKWESDGISVSVSKARKIANVFNRHWTTLLLPTIPKKKGLSKEYRRMLDNNNFSTETMLGFRNAERVLYLAKTIDGRLTNKIEINSLNVKLNSNLNILSKVVLDWLNITFEEIKKCSSDYEALAFWIYKIEEKGIYVSQIGMPLDEISAFTLSDNERSVIVLNKRDGNKRRLFSLVHELGHILLNSNKSFDILESNESDNDTEIFCNKFAGNLLVPDNYVKKYWFDIGEIDKTISKLTSIFQVSEQVSLRRIYDLGFIDRLKFESKNAELVESYKDFIRNAKKKGFVPPKGFFVKTLIKKNSFAFTEDLFNAYRLQSVTYHDISAFLGVNLKHIPTIEHIITNI